MALTVVPLGLSGTAKIVKQTSATATADKNVGDGSVTVYAVRLENDTTGGAAAFLKGYNNDGVSTTLTIGTTVPDMILKVPFTAGASGVLSGRTYVFKGGNTFFSSALSLAAVTAGGTGGVTPPTQAVQYFVDLA